MPTYFMQGCLNDDSILMEELMKTPNFTFMSLSHDF